MTGQRIGNWILAEPLAHRSLGEAYHAMAADDPTHAATVTFLSHESTRAPGFLARFPADMLGLHRLKHPNVVQFYDAGVFSGRAWYATEAVVGVDCETVLKKRAAKPGKEPGLSWHNDVLGAAVQAARALKHGHHRSILHRDLKPANLVLTREGVLKVGDFGVAKFLPASPMTLPADPWGPLGFLAPEHFNGKQLTKKSDLYALGCVLYTLVTGRPPFTANSAAEYLHKHCYTLPDRPSRFVPDLPTDLDELICALMAKDPARRPASAMAVIEALDAIRGRLERKGRKIAWPTDPGDASETTPALGEDEGKPREEEYDPRPLMSRPLVVVPLLLFVIALTVGLIFRPRPSAEDLYSEAVPLLESKDPADWDKAWAEYLEPLSERYPDEYRDEVQAARARINSRRELRRAIDQGRRADYGSEAERLYNRGLKLAQAGDAVGARNTWEQLRQAFAGVPGQEHWVTLAATALQELSSASFPPDGERPTLHAAIEQVRRWKAEGKLAEAKARLDALLYLYRDDPAALELLRGVR